MFSVAAHSHVLVQPRPLVPLALSINSACTRCFQLFPYHFPEHPFYYCLFPISFLFLQFLCLCATCLSGSACHDLLIFAQLQNKVLFNPIYFSLFVYISFCGITPYPALNYNLVYCPFPLLSFI